MKRYGIEIFAIGLLLGTLAGFGQHLPDASCSANADPNSPTALDDGASQAEQVQQTISIRLQVSVH